MIIAPRRARDLALPVLIAGLALLNGCSSSSSSAPARPAPSAGTPTVAEPTPVAISTLREAAIAKVNQLSRSDLPNVRANAVEAAGLSSRRLTSVIEAGLRDPNPGVRTVAATVVGREKLAKIAPAAYALRNDISSYARASAIFAAQRNSLNPDLSPLGTILTESPTTRERAHAAVLLGDLGDRSALPMLRQAASRRVQRASALDNRLMELQVAEAMVKLGDEEQVQTIRAALYPSRPEELEAAALAAQILGTLGDKGSAGQLVQMAGPAGKPASELMPAEIRLAAVTALARMGYRDGQYVADQYAADPNPALRAQAAYAYGQIRTPGSLARLGQLLEDPSPTVAISAAAGILHGNR